MDPLHPAQFCDAIQFAGIICLSVWKIKIQIQILTTVLKVSSRHRRKSIVSLQGSTSNLLRFCLPQFIRVIRAIQFLNFASDAGTNCKRECPINSCEAGQHCRLVRGTPVCGVVGVLRRGDETLQQEDEHLDDWWANYLLHHPKKSNVAKRTNSKKHNAGGPFQGPNANHIPKERNPNKKSSNKLLPCPPSSCAPGFRCRMVGEAPVCFLASPLTIGLRNTNSK